MKLTLKHCSDPATARALTRAFNVAVAALGVDTYAVEVHVSVLPAQVKAICKETPFGTVTGFGVVAGETEPNLKGNVATVKLYALNTISTVQTLLHELTHVAQMLRGDLKRVRGVAVWKGRAYREPESQEEYESRPWEREANEFAERTYWRL